MRPSHPPRRTGTDERVLQVSADQATVAKAITGGYIHVHVPNSGSDTPRVVTVSIFHDSRADPRKLQLHPPDEEVLSFELERDQNVDQHGTKLLEATFQVSGA